MRHFFSAKVNRKVVGLSILLSLAICLACCISGYIQYRDSMYKSYNDFAYMIADTARSYVNADKVISYAETGKTDTDYDEMARNIYNLYCHTSLHEYQSGIYISIPDETAENLTNVFDVRIFEAGEDVKQFYEIGVVDPVGVNSQHLLEILETQERCSDYFVHESKYGYNSSAILPVINSQGESVAFITADMPMPYLSETLNRYLITTVAISAIIGVIFVSLFITTMRRTVTNPLKTIANEAQAFSKSEIQLSTVLPNFRQEDEIGQLARGIYRMEEDIQTYVENLTAVTAEKERIGAELDVARNIQAAMLPCIFPAFPDRDDLDIYATMTPAKEVGGDFYDFFMVDDRHIAIVMADVSGKGVPAALFMVIGKTLIKDHTALHKDLNDVFTDVNNLLCETNSEGLFITAFEGVLDLETGEFIFVNAGHEMPFLYRKGEGYTPHKIRPGFVLAGMEDMRFRCGSLQLEVGDKIFQYTDGVTEATNSEEKLYGMERLEAILNRCRDDSPQETLRKVKADIDAFVGEAPQFDDITMLCLEYKKKFQPKNIENAAEV